jgi:hypothetical protein
MDLRRLRAGEWITALSGVVLAVSLFLPWYSRGEVDYSAWQAFAIVDVLLFLLAVLTIGLLVLTAVQPTAAIGIAADALLTILAGVVAIIAVIRVLNLPGSLEALGGALERAPFAWVGLLAVLGVLVGATVAMRDERLSRPGELTDATGVPVSAPPEIETFPAPPRGSAGG